MTHIIKRQRSNLPANWRIEAYNPSKLHKSIHSTCLSVRTPPGEADLTAKRVCQAVGLWLENHFEVTSADIRRKAGESLHIHNPEAAYLYQQQHIMA